MKTVKCKKLTVCAVILTVALVTACSDSGDSGMITALNTPVSTKFRVEGEIETTSLLSSLAKEYPNGKLPAEHALEAAKSLSQNPSVFKNSVAVASQASISPQNLQSQAFSVADFYPVYRIQNTTLPGSYFFTIYDFEKTAALAANPNWKLEGTAFYTLPAASTDLSPVYRFRNKVNGSYLYTAFESEKTDIETNYGATYALEGIAWRAQQAPAVGYVPLYRFRNLTNGTYLFTAFESEKNAIVAQYPDIFELEGPAYYVLNSVPPSCTPAVNGATGYALVFKACNGPVAEYYDKTECVKDLATGLIWEGKPASGTRSTLNIHLSNYDDINKLQGSYIIGTGAPPNIVFTTVYYKPTQAQIDALNNTKGYQSAVNTINLCGFSDWRRPSPSELLALVKPGASPQIDSTWFPKVIPPKKSTM